jgi:predicted amidohydrolase
MKIALAQMKMTDNVNENLKKTIQYIEQAKNENSDLIFFPELQLTPFFPSGHNRDISQYLMNTESPEISAICQACRENKIYASVNVFLNENGHNYDASIMISRNGEILGISKMVHIASFPNFYEAEYYTPSDTGFLVYDLPIGKVGTVICFDRHFPESIRECVAQGAELIIIPTANLTDEPVDMFLWEIRVQAMQSNVCIAMCNRVGTENDITFCGRSVIADYRGDVIKYADESEQLLAGELDLEAVRQTRINSPYFNFK